MAVELKNFTPLPNFQFANWDAQGKEFGILMVKTAWDILDDGYCVLSQEQEPFVMTDEFYGEVNQSSVKYTSDLVPFKPETDFILNATAFAPNKEAAKAWDAAVTIFNANSQQKLIEKVVRIYGPRQWQPARLGWELTEPRSITHLDVRYEHAYGGSIVTGNDEQGQPIVEAYEYNPIGCGLIDEQYTKRKHAVSAPQIVDPNDLITDPFKQYSPVGLGAIPAAWLPRRPLGGTYDQAWLDNTWPKWAKDYRFSFHNAAAQGLRCQLPLNADLQIQLNHLHPDLSLWVINLPHSRLQATLLQNDQVRHYALAVDSIYLDIAREQLADPRIFTLSRLVFDRNQTDSILLMSLDEDKGYSHLQAPPTPEQVTNGNAT